MQGERVYVVLRRIEQIPKPNNKMIKTGSVIWNTRVISYPYWETSLIRHSVWLGLIIWFHNSLKILLQEFYSTGHKTGFYFPGLKSFFSLSRKESVSFLRLQTLSLKCLKQNSRHLNQSSKSADRLGKIVRFPFLFFR